MFPITTAPVVRQLRFPQTKDRDSTICNYWWNHTIWFVSEENVLSRSFNHCPVYSWMMLCSWYVYQDIKLWLCYQLHSSIYTDVLYSFKKTFKRNFLKSQIAQVRMFLSIITRGQPIRTAYSWLMLLTQSYFSSSSKTVLVMNRCVCPECRLCFKSGSMVSKLSHCLEICSTSFHCSEAYGFPVQLLY